MPEENKPTPTGAFFNFSLTDIFGAGKGIEKLVAAFGGGAGRLTDGIGGIANVKWLDKARADNDAYRTQVVGDAQTRVMENRARAIAALAREGQQLQNMSIAEGGVSAQLAGVSPEVKGLYERAQLRSATENAMQQLNLETTMAYAATELAGEEQISDSPIDPDWKTRFVRTVQDISRDDAQVIFGKILAGEIKEPGTFSARTIDFLATLSQYEGELFRKLCSFVWWRDDEAQVILFRSAKHEHIELKFAQLQLLQEVGLIAMQTSVFGGYCIRRQSVVLSYGDSVIELESRTKDSETESAPVIDTGVVLLTSTGRELAHVCQPILDPAIMEYAIEQWVDKGHNVTRLPNT
jgi:hypothetical protein